MTCSTSAIRLTVCARRDLRAPSFPANTAQSAGACTHVSQCCQPLVLHLTTGAHDCPARTSQPKALASFTAMCPRLAATPSHCPHNKQPWTTHLAAECLGQLHRHVSQSAQPHHADLLARLVLQLPSCWEAERSACNTCTFIERRMQTPPVPGHVAALQQDVATAWPLCMQMPDVRHSTHQAKVAQRGVGGDACRRFTMFEFLS